MAVTGVGPALAIDGPLPAPPAYNLFTVARPVSEEIGADGQALERWRNGVTLRGYPPALPEGFDPCSTGTFRVKGEGDVAPLPRFLPFTASLAEACTGMGVGPWAEFQARANAALTATEAYALERQLAQGDPIPTNPYLGDSHLTILGGGAVTPQVGLSYLEDAIAATGRAGVIHATPSVAAAWSALGYTVERVGGGNQGGSLRTVGNWTPVIVGYGYVGTDPASGATPAAGQSWAFATGPVVYGRSNELIPVPDTIREATDRELNDVVYRAERDLLAAWDGVLQAGILVDWTP